MPNSPLLYLYVDMGSAVTKASLFSYEEAGFKLLEQKSFLTADQSVPEVEALFNLPAEPSEVFVSCSPKLEAAEIKGSAAEEELLKIFCQDLAQRENFLVLEIGATKSWVWQGVNGKCQNHLTEGGVGKGARRAVREFASEAKLARWLPDQVSYEDIGDYIGNKSIFPGQLPLTEKSLCLEQALARELLSYLTQKINVDWEVIGRVILGGAVLAKVPDLGQAMLMFLDAAAVEGVSEVWADRRGLLPFLSRLRGESYAYLTCLGTALILTHQQKPGVILGRVFLDWGLDEEMEVILRSGDLVRVPLGPSQKCSVRVELGGSVELKGFNPDARLKGGEVGLVIDARGRPLVKPEVNEDGRRKVREWREEMR